MACRHIGRWALAVRPAWIADNTVTNAQLEFKPDTFVGIRELKTSSLLQSTLPHRFIQYKRHLTPTATYLIKLM
ncbi:hypothetical protein EYF80_021276 [Liparis tanakae]|uniref:Uncharacterized protein n=1 Tax=Liparis tanakae TaxID=230148 RepID=A0A4Z2HSG3_9TELE|nr:hypothetical protein EYF80_021276 [Liparis tanakae]